VRLAEIGFDATEDDLIAVVAQRLSPQLGLQQLCK
jgi:hypothetical protein